MRDFAGGVAEEQEVSCLTFVPLFCRHDVAGEGLLRSIAGENDSGRKIGRFDKSRTVGAFDRSAAPEVSRSHHSFGGLYDFIHVYGSRCPLGEFATFVVFQKSGSSIGERHGYELFSRLSCGLQNTARYDVGHGFGIFICGGMLFVGIPLPGTGAWTGALVASLLHMKFGKAFGAILVGIALATVIMSILSYGVLGVLFG